MKKKYSVLTVLWMLSFLFIHCDRVLASEEKNAYFSKDYTYTVRVFSGNQGTFEDGSTMIKIKVSEGTTIDLRNVLAGIQMNTAKDALGNEIENKYYAKGIRESGKDNNTADLIFGPVFYVTRDIDYVVCYGVPGGDVSYTVQYIDEETGKELLPSQTFYGNVGDKPVVAYQYVNGYQPQAYNLSRTLTEDEEKNVFPFLYHKSKITGYYSYETNGEVKYVDKMGETIVEWIPGNIIYVNGGGSPVTFVPGGTFEETSHGEVDIAGYVENTGEEINDHKDVVEEEPAELIVLDELPVPLSDDALDGDGWQGDGQEGNGILLSEMTDSIFFFSLVMISTILGVIITATVFVIRKKAIKKK